MEDKGVGEETQNLAENIFYWVKGNEAIVSPSPKPCDLSNFPHKRHLG